MQYKDFDFEGRVKVPVGFYLMLVYLLRGYFIWIMSLTHRDNPGLIISLIYPQPSFFYSAMLIGIPSLFGYVLFLSKGRLFNRFETMVWPAFYWFIALGCALDLSVQGLGILHSKWLVHWTTLVSFITGIYLLWYWLGSKRIKRFFVHWLEPADDSKSPD